MFEAGASTEKLHGAGAIGLKDLSSRSYAETPVRKRRIALYFWIAGVVASLVIAGAIIGALIAKNVIKVHSASGLAPAVVSDKTGMSSTLGDANTATATSTLGSSSTPSSSTASSPTTSNTPKSTACSTSKDIPSDAKGTWTDVSSWLDMTDFNCTFTDETVGGLPVVGLNSTWDDSKQANSNVPALNNTWGSYGSKPFRGVSLGGWLSLEPFITPSLFNFESDIYDEWALCSKLGPTQAAATLEKHYSTFISENDIKAIAAAGLDHIRIPFSYWAVKTYDNDPYVMGVSWRYLLRGIEWARKHGLRVKLDLHGVPGSQNGWNHSGKQGTVDWISGPDGATNAQRTLDIHTQLSTFFAQDRYKNVIAFYGLVNEPAISIPQDELITWTEEAYKIVQDDGISAPQVFSESMRGLGPWQGKLTGYGNSLVIDVHEYTIFDNALLGMKHADRVAFACNGWTSQITAGMNPATGFGPVMVGEWSQADTDCAQYLNGVGNGDRWTGTFSSGSGSNTPNCPTQDSLCSCDQANAPSSSFSNDYKIFLQTWAEAQMDAFEKSWGWFYWTWKTETSPLWSYQAGLQSGYLPPLAYQRSWDCSMAVPSFGSLPEFY